MTSVNDKDQIITVLCAPLNEAFDRQRTLTLKEGTIINVGRQLEEGPEQPNTLKFPAVVVSRQHARIICKGMKLYVQDTMSSGGTWLNHKLIKKEKKDGDLFELKDGDELQFGTTSVHPTTGTLNNCVLMSVKIIVPVITSAQDNSEDTYHDVINDPQLKANVDQEYEDIWNHLTHNVHDPMVLLKKVLAAAK